MIQNGLNKFYWGFLFIMLTFRIQGFDILPDIIGYILFAVGFSNLRSFSGYFNKAALFNIPMIILSIFTIYQPQVQAGRINVGPLGGLGILVSIASFIFNLLVVYNLFMGINDLEKGQEQIALAQESRDRWYQYLALQIAAIFSFVMIFIPFLALVYVIGVLIAAIIIMVKIMGFIGRCRDSIV